MRQPEIQNLLRASAQQELRPRLEAVQSALEEALQLQAWSQAARSPRTSELIQARVQEIAGELLSQLLDWRRMGGQVSLSLGDALAAPAPSLLLPAVSEPLPAASLPPLPAPVVAPVSAPVAAPSLTPMSAAPVPSATRVVAGPALSSGASTSSNEDAPPAREHAHKAVSLDWHADLTAILSSINLTLDDELELEQVTRCIRESDRWKVLPREAQRSMVGLMACRLRRLQDERGIHTLRLEENFGKLSGYSKREQPGYVVGLSRHHRPMRDTWEEDAEAYLDRLQALLPGPLPGPANQDKLLVELEKLLPDIERPPVPEIREAALSQFRRNLRDALKAGVSSRAPKLVQLCAPLAESLDHPDFRALRRAIRLLEREESGIEEDDTAATPAADWRWWGRTQGRRVVMVGGEPREASRRRLQEAFQMAELEWESAEVRRNALQHIRDRVRAGKVELVIVLGAFVGHDADEIVLPACREKGVDWVHVDNGYGVARVRSAVERFLDPMDAST